jgi:hypothetical protein
MRRVRQLFFVLTLLIFSQNINAQVETPLERRLGFGAEFGIIGAVVGGPYFGMAFSADYILARNFSLGEIISFIPSADLTQVNFNTIARFNIPMEGFSLIPYMGIGFSYGSYETDQGNENSFSFAFPLGLSIAIPVAAQIEVVGRFQFALTNLDYETLGTDKNYSEFMAGFRYSP